MSDITFSTNNVRNWKIFRTDRMHGTDIYVCMRRTLGYYMDGYFIINAVYGSNDHMDGEDRFTLLVT